jgi:large subunit ribosomal protein L27
LIVFSIALFTLKTRLRLIGVMAHTKAIGSTQLGRDSQPKYLGVKLHDGQVTKVGNIIVRQRGSKYLPGTGVRQGSDYTIYSVVEGKVKFTTTRKKNFNGSRRVVKVVHVIAN